MLHWGAYRVNSSVKFAASVKYTASLPALARSRPLGGAGGATGYAGWGMAYPELLPGPG
jgi:hypothetical protein